MCPLVVYQWLGNMTKSKIVHISVNFRDRGLKLGENIGEVILTNLSAISMGWMKSSLRLDLIPGIRRTFFQFLHYTFVSSGQELATLM